MRGLFLLLAFAANTVSVKAQTSKEANNLPEQNQDNLLPAMVCNDINGNETAIFNLKLKNDSLVYTIDYNGKARWSLALKDILYQDVNQIAIAREPYYDACPDLIYFIIQSAQDKISYYRRGVTGVEILEKDSILSIVFDKNKKNDALKALQAIMQLAKSKGAKENR